MSLSARRAWIEISGSLVIFSNTDVALRKESVDRNMLIWNNSPTQAIVALRKESVDRNVLILPAVMLARTSLSARRAWIEILWPLSLRLCLTSLSARRAWIEIPRR